MQATHQAAGWETRLRHAETPLRALTPPRGRGKRPLTDDATRVEAMDRVLTAPRVDGLLRVTWDKPVEQPTQDGGRGRGAVQREKRVSQTIRSDITPSARQADTIAALSHRVGWKAGVTQAEHTRRSFQDAVFCSRHAYRVARLFHRLKRRVPIAPLGVTRNEHLEGLTSLLTLGVRV